ncbi:MAG: hypothetical protein E3J88_05720, partial [Anaerolineales bacterium]
MSIVCPNCHSQEPEGTFYCSECGTDLVDDGGLSTATIRQTDSQITMAGEAPVAPPPAPITEAQVACISSARGSFCRWWVGSNSLSAA